MTRGRSISIATCLTLVALIVMGLIIHRDPPMTINTIDVSKVIDNGPAYYGHGQYTIIIRTVNGQDVVAYQTDKESIADRLAAKPEGRVLTAIVKTYAGSTEWNLRWIKEVKETALIEAG
jgi:hypothetical protein